MLFVMSWKFCGNKKVHDAMMLDEIGVYVGATR